ncbi:unnamed protein product [Cylicostephanus goldi]|uniref:Elapor1/2 TNF receptor-like domain-containing protein n=1 Tax=Cylicostephanus goldi TaxID=71465 RepID=A0A3P6UP87_CYLGO|nr:unnamed protein product [Cylicostephanus goldi]
MPSPSATRECPPCNPGMAKDSNGVCVFCPTEHFSQGDACIRCPVETVPNYGYEYVQWDTIPPNIVTRCEYISEGIVVNFNEKKFEHSSECEEAKYEYEEKLRSRFSSPSTLVDVKYVAWLCNAGFGLLAQRSTLAPIPPKN